MRFSWSLGPIATASFAFVFVVLVVNGVVVHQNTIALHAKQKWIDHTYAVLMQSQSLFSSLRDLESTARDFMISGSNLPLARYRELNTAILARKRSLGREIFDNPAQIDRLAELNQRIDDRLGHLEKMIAIASKEGSDAARNFMLANDGNRAEIQIQSALGEFETEENRLLSVRTHEQDYSHFVVLAANLVGTILGATTSIIAWYFVDRELGMRRSAEAVAHLERQNLLVTLNSIVEGVVVTDSKGQVILLNPSAKHLLGNLPVIHGRQLSNLFSMVDEVTREPIENPVNMILSGGSVNGKLLHPLLIRTDGEKIPIEHSAAPIHDATGHITGAVFVFRDCSAQRKSQKEMREHGLLFQRVFETPLIGVAVGTSQGDLLEANDTFLDLIGYHRGELGEITRGQDRIPLSQIPLDEDVQLELREKGVCKPFEKTQLRIDGTRIPVLVSAARLADVHDRIVVFVTDLSQSKRAEAALLETEARFRALSECMPQKVWTARSDGHIDYLNHYLLEYAGLPIEQMQELGWSNLIHPVDAQRQAEAWRRSLASGDVFEIELRFCNHAGEYRWHLARALPIYGSEGEIALWVGTYTDIHNQKQSEEMLREEHHRKDEFLALLAHELRNPLAPLSNAIQVFPQVQNDRERVDELLNIMNRQVRQMIRLIDDLLDLARITTGRMRLNRERVLVASAVSAAVESVQPLVSERHHQLEINQPDRQLWLDADGARIIQILTNLLHNAAKFTDSNGKISLTVQHSETDVVFRISDNGPGISSEMLTKIFDLFTQVEQTLDRTHGGLGIGLTLVRTLVEMHGGTITASSVGLGHGSEFVVRLPLADAPQLTAPVGEFLEKARVSPVLSPVHRVLVVDDVGASAKTLALMLQRLGQDVEIAFDGPSAIALAEASDFDIIFLDIAMPGMDGLEVARRLRANPRHRSTTLVAITGFGQDGDRANTRLAGFNGHLTKPVSLEQLMDNVRRELTAEVGSHELNC